jgi:radical SAM superfamily enzyme YgiQ (UPF0313 family)
LPITTAERARTCARGSARHLAARGSAPHADTIFLGPGEDTFPQFLRDLAAGSAESDAIKSACEAIEDIPPIRRDLIQRSRYLGAELDRRVARLPASTARSATRTHSSRAGESF